MKAYNITSQETEAHKTTTLDKLPRGEWFTLKPSPTAKVYRKYEYDRTSKKYCCEDVMDAGGAGRELKGSTKVFYGFTY
jgi:hypothetical protein